MSIPVYLYAIAFSFTTVLSILSIVKIRNLEDTIAELANAKVPTDATNRLDQLDKKIDLVSDELDEKLDLFHDDLINSMKDFIDQAE
jgi:peptidoglycan hydrolase CwlO-like protein